MIVGGSAWESNPAPPRWRGATGFEDREGHRAPFASGREATIIARASGSGAKLDEASVWRRNGKRAGTDAHRSIERHETDVPCKNDATFPGLEGNPTTEGAPSRHCAGTAREIQLSIRRTSPARGPLPDSSGVKSTRWPSRSNSNTAPRTALRWKKCSIPPSSRMNPNPLSINRRAIVPLGIPYSSDIRTPVPLPRRTDATLTSPRPGGRCSSSGSEQPPEPPATPDGRGAAPETGNQYYTAPRRIIQAFNLESRQSSEVRQWKSSVGSGDGPVPTASGAAIRMVGSGGGAARQKRGGCDGGSTSLLRRFGG